MLALMHDRPAVRRWLLATGGAVLVCAPLVVAFAPSLAARVNAAGPVVAETRSIDERLALAEGAIAIFLERPVLGVGLGTLPQAMVVTEPGFDRAAGRARRPARRRRRDRGRRRGLLSRADRGSVGRDRARSGALDAGARRGLRPPGCGHDRRVLRPLHVDDTGRPDLGRDRPWALGGRLPGHACGGGPCLTSSWCRSWRSTSRSWRSSSRTLELPVPDLARAAPPDRPDLRPRAPEAWPVVTVQLPVYNEVYVVERLIDACVRLDYPPERARDPGPRRFHRRDRRARRRAASPTGSASASTSSTSVATSGPGFKAGALAAGLASARGDADRDLRRRLRPAAGLPDGRRPGPRRRPGLAFVQARWGHINRDDSLLTSLQALSIDGHFAVEQAGAGRRRLLVQLQRHGRDLAARRDRRCRRLARRHADRGPRPLVPRAPARMAGGVSRRARRPGASCP